jgi:hypothetical protein
MLWNVVERTFGTWKKRFPILVHPLEYSLETQRDLVLALAVLHNIIINNNGMSNCFMETKAKIAARASEDEPDPPKEEDEPLSESRTCKQARQLCGSSIKNISLGTADDRDDACTIKLTAKKPSLRFFFLICTCFFSLWPMTL